MSSYSSVKMNQHLDFLYHNLKRLSNEDRVEAVYFLKKRTEGFDIKQDNIVEISNLVKKYDPSHRKWLEDNQKKINKKHFIEQEAEVVIDFDTDEEKEEMKKTIANLCFELDQAYKIIKQYSDNNKHIQKMIRK